MGVMVYDLVVYRPGGPMVGRFRVSAEVPGMAFRLADRYMREGLCVRLRLVEWAL